MPGHALGLVVEVGGCSEPDTGALPVVQVVVAVVEVLAAAAAAAVVVVAAVVASGALASIAGYHFEDYHCLDESDLSHDMLGEVASLRHARLKPCLLVA